MDERIEFIFYYFAQWSKQTKQQYDDRFITTPYMKDIKNDALESYKALLKSPHDTLKSQRFHHNAYIYFMLRIDMKDVGKTDYVLEQYDNFNDKWAIVQNQLFNENGDFNNGTVSEFLERLEALENSDIDIIIQEALQTFSITYDCYVDDGCENKNLYLLSDILADYMSEEERKLRLTESAVYEGLGRRYAQNHFEALLPKKAGRKKSSMGILDAPHSNLDSQRAHAIMRIVEGLNAELLKARQRKTSISEVCELLLGQNNLLGTYKDAEPIKWALKFMFKAECITSQAFMNSISRGRARLQVMDSL